MMSTDKQTRELYINMEAAYREFHKAVSDFVHHVQYPVDFLDRDLDGKISCARINISGGGRILFRHNEWNVSLPVEGNTINLDMLEEWESKEIDDEIQYHSNQLNALMKRKQELTNKMR